jgi:uncharacterized protein YigA (DUF484 family)
MDEKAVADYLKSHPEFFERYADLLTQVLIPDPHGGRAISITERQIGLLRERSKTLEAKLSELVRFGEDNDAIAQKLHRLAVALTAGRDLDALLRALYTHLTEDFAIPHVVLRFWAPAPTELSAGRPEFEPQDDETHAFAASLKYPHCGPTSALQAFPWLPDSVRSVAVMPLQRSGEAFGILALGSEEAHRFHPDMGTLYLTRLSELVTAALLCRLN